MKVLGTRPGAVIIDVSDNELAQLMGRSYWDDPNIWWIINDIHQGNKTDLTSEIIGNVDHVVRED